MARKQPRARRATLGTSLAVVLAALSAVLSTSPAAAATVFADGFENPRIFADFETFTAGQQLGPWTVTSGTVDLTRDWQDADGDQSLDLNGYNAGAVTRTVPTSLLTTYRVTYALAGNPDSGDIVATGTVRANGRTVDTFRFDTTGQSPSDMGYVYRTVYFTNLLSGSAALEFASTTEGAYGPVIDAVKVESCVLVVCPANAKVTRIS